MRKILCLIIALAACLLAVTVVSAEVSAANVPTTCAAGCENPDWQPLPSGNWNTLSEGHYHYYLTKNDTSYRYTPNPNNGGAKVTICLDLNGYHIDTSGKDNGRALGLYSGCTLNIMDSSAEQTGYIQGTTGNNATVGGTMFAYGTFNLYSGTIRYVYDGVGTNQAYAGGVISMGDGYANATFNMYGGRLEGGKLVVNSSRSYGGTIYAGNGNINVYAGEIISGSVPEGYNGPCVYLSGSAKITLSGDAKVDDIYIASNSGKVNISGTYSGKARVTYASSVSLSNGKVIGTGSNTPSITGDLMCTNGNGWNITLDGSNVKLATFTPSATRHYCQHCKDIVNWTAMTSSNYATPKNTSGTYHYYLSSKQALYVQVGNEAGTTRANLCLDLYGNTLQPSSGRAILVWGDSSTLNLMDTKGGGKVHSVGGGNNERGATISVSGGHTFNMYSGTVSFEANGSTFTKRGVIAIGGTMNMYGGTIQGADLTTGASSTGGAIYMYNSTSALNLYGGTITSGTVNSVGPCVCINTTGQTVKLAGNANVENIYFATNDQDLTVSGNYTGTASVTYAAMPDLGAVVGVSDNATISGSLTCTNGNRLIKVDGTNLITAIDAPVVVVDGETETGYSTLQEAITKCTSGYVKLLNSFSDDITVAHTVTVDLNGFNLTGTITLSEGAALYGMDSQTDDYTVEDGNGYGKVTDTANITPAEGYLPVTEDDKISFHKVTIKITDMTLRPSVAGIYYKSSFLGDEKVAGAVESFGVALSVQGTPTEDNLETHCKYSTFQNFEAGATGNASTSTILTGILKTGNTLLKNVRNLNMDVYGRPYIKTADGYIFGQSHTRDLAKQMQDIDAIFSSLGGSQRIALLDMFGTYQSALNTLSLPNTVAGKEKAENTLSILMVGNSFCYYYVEELYGLLMANPDPNRGYEHVEIYNLYKSGCTLTEHYTWWLSGAANYEHLYLTNENGRKSITPASGGKWNLEMTLQEGDWDYISLQGASTGNNYATGDIDTICASISSLAEPLLDRFHTLFPDAQLLWHRTWPFEIGRISGSTTYDEELLAMYNTGMQAACDYMCNEFDQDQPYDLKMVNSGAAWVVAREENAKLETSLIPVEGGLCARKGTRNENTFPYYEGNADAGDGYHDGDIGGGQFLNASVWYETITGQSILENTYRPTLENGKYELSEEFADLLRNAAHAVGTIEE